MDDMEEEPRRRRTVDPTIAEEAKRIRIAESRERMNKLYAMTGVSEELPDAARFIKHYTEEYVNESMVREGYESLRGVRIMKKGRKFEVFLEDSQEFTQLLNRGFQDQILGRRVEVTPFLNAAIWTMHCGNVPFGAIKDDIKDLAQLVIDNTQADNIEIRGIEQQRMLGNPRVRTGSWTVDIYVPFEDETAWRDAVLPKMHKGFFPAKTISIGWTRKKAGYVDAPVRRDSNSGGGNNEERRERGRNERDERSRKAITGNDKSESTEPSQSNGGYVGAVTHGVQRVGASVASGKGKESVFGMFSLGKIPAKKSAGIDFTSSKQVDPWNPLEADSRNPFQDRSSDACHETANTGGEETVDITVEAKDTAPEQHGTPDTGEEQPDAANVAADEPPGEEGKAEVGVAERSQETEGGETLDTEQPNDAAVEEVSEKEEEKRTEEDSDEKEKPEQEGSADAKNEEREKVEDACDSAPSEVALDTNEENPPAPPDEEEQIPDGISTDVSNDSMMELSDSPKQKRMLDADSGTEQSVRKFISLVPETETGDAEAEHAKGTRDDTLGCSALKRTVEVYESLQDLQELKFGRINYPHGSNEEQSLAEITQGIEDYRYTSVGTPTLYKRMALATIMQGGKPGFLMEEGEMSSKEAWGLAGVMFKAVGSVDEARANDPLNLMLLLEQNNPDLVDKWKCHSDKKDLSPKMRKDIESNAKRAGERYQELQQREQQLNNSWFI